LSDDNDVVELLQGGLLEGLQSGKVLVNHGSGASGKSRRLAGELEKRGILYFDTPVSGGRAGALARTLTTMVGVELKGFEAARAIFETFSYTVALLGPSGSGQMAKLLNNALVMSNLQNSVEVW
jgi:3-hydroxyisobutyrate dehydrogenase-like beta-hydroxyacid dehydrogenase